METRSVPRVDYSKVDIFKRSNEKLSTNHFVLLSITLKTSFHDKEYISTRRIYSSYRNIVKAICCVPPIQVTIPVKEHCRHLGRLLSLATTPLS